MAVAVFTRGVTLERMGAPPSVDVEIYKPAEGWATVFTPTWEPSRRRFVVAEDTFLVVCFISSSAFARPLSFRLAFLCKPHLGNCQLHFRTTSICASTISSPIWFCKFFFYVTHQIPSASYPSVCSAVTATPFPVLRFSLSLYTPAVAPTQLWLPSQTPRIQSLQHVKGFGCSHLQPTGP